MLAEMADKFPELNKVFVQERDIYLTYSLQLAAFSPPSNLFNNCELSCTNKGLLFINYFKNYVTFS